MLLRAVPAFGTMDEIADLQEASVVEYRDTERYLYKHFVMGVRTAHCMNYSPICLIAGKTCWEKACVCDLSLV